MVYVSHKLEEILRLSDRVTVLRDGQVVAPSRHLPWTKTVSSL
jgi:ABC-type sugar transport system ATPase subunit